MKNSIKIGTFLVAIWLYNVNPLYSTNAITDIPRSKSTLLNTINLTLQQQLTALLFAIVADNQSLFSKLLDANPSLAINKNIDCEGNATIFLAVWANNSYMVQELIKKGASVNVLSSSNRTPLQYAQGWNIQPMINILLNAKKAEAEGPEEDNQK